MRTLALLLAAVALGACADAFDPTSADGPAAALHGTIDGAAERQALRVQAFGAPVFGTPETLPVTVASTELASGRRTVWRDSLITLADGGRAHLFVAALAPAMGEAHRIEATRDADGATASLTVRFPSPTATAGPPNDQPNAAVRIEVGGVGGEARQPRLAYRVRRTDGTGDTTFTAPAVLEPGAAPGGLSVLAFLATAQDRATRILYGASAGQPVLVEARLEAVVSSAGPVPIENGLGEVEWRLPVTVPVPLAPATLDRVGFVDGQSP